MFGAAYIAVTLAIALRRRSLASCAALPALIGTVALFWLDVDHAGAYSSALWVLAGGFLIFQALTSKDTPINSELLSGTLYGISGIVYVAFYLGASNDTLSIIPIISDLCFGFGLIIGTWPRAFIGFGRGVRRAIRWLDVQNQAENSQGISVHDRAKG